MPRAAFKLDETTEGTLEVHANIDFHSRRKAAFNIEREKFCADSLGDAVSPLLRKLAELLLISESGSTQLRIRRNMLSIMHSFEHGSQKLQEIRDRIVEQIIEFCCMGRYNEILIIG